MEARIKMWEVVLMELELQQYPTELVGFWYNGISGDDKCQIYKSYCNVFNNDDRNNQYVLNRGKDDFESIARVEILILEIGFVD